MKTLILVRHAKSSWKHPHLDDHDRPVNKRGKRDIPVMAEHLVSRVADIDLIMSSSAVRAAKFAQQIQVLSGSRLIADKALYTFNAMRLLSSLAAVSDDIHTLVAVGHNPAITELSNYLCDGSIRNVPTSGLVCLQLGSDQWQGLNANSCTFKWLDTPKTVRNVE